MYVCKYIYISQLHGDALCGTGSQSHHEEKETDGPNHRLFILPNTTGTKGLPIAFH